MRLNVVRFGHGKTTPDCSAHCETGATDGRHFNLSRVLATMSGSASAGFVRSHPRTKRRGSGRGPCDRGSTPSRLPQAPVGGVQPCPQLGRTTAIPAHPREMRQNIMYAGVLRYCVASNMFVISKIHLATMACIIHYVTYFRPSHQILSAERQDLCLLSGARVLSPPKRAAVSNGLQHHRPAARHPRAQRRPRGG